MTGSWIPGCEDRDFQRIIGRRRLGAEGNAGFRSHSQAEAELEDANGYGLWQPMENRFCQTSLISFVEESTSLTERLLNKCSIELRSYATFAAA